MDGEYLSGLARFKDAQGLDSYSVNDREVLDKLSEIYNYKKNDVICRVSIEKMKGVGYENVTYEKVFELNLALKQYNITSEDEINHFLAQCYAESWHGKATLERNWPGEVPDEQYFNEQYGHRTDIGNEIITDGYKYRGAGYIQLTGKSNYAEFAKVVNDDKVVELGAEYVAENYAWEAAAWYWSEKVHKLFVDNPNPSVEQVTARINPKLNELDERKIRYEKIVSYDRGE